MSTSRDNTTLFFAPGQTTEGNRFSSFLELYAVYQARQDVRVIIFDGSAATPNVPAHAYEWRTDLQWWGTNLAGNPNVVLANGVTFNLMPALDQLITVEGQSNSPILTVSNEDILVWASNYSAWLNNGTVPMIRHASASHFVSCILNSGGGFYTGATPVIGLVDPGAGSAGCFVTLLDNGIISDDTFAGDGGDVYTNIFLADQNAVLSNYQPNYASALYDWVDLGIFASASVPSYQMSQDVSTTSVTIFPGQRKRYNPTGTAGAIVLGLPDKNYSRWPGMRCAIKNVTADVTLVTVQPTEAGETIDGAASDVVAGAHAKQEYEFDGISDWFKCV